MTHFCCLKVTLRHAAHFTADQEATCRISLPYSACFLDFAPMWASKVESGSCNQAPAFTAHWPVAISIASSRVGKGTEKESGKQFLPLYACLTLKGKLPCCLFLLQRPQTIASGPLPAVPLQTSPLCNSSDYQDSSLVSYSSVGFLPNLSGYQNSQVPPGLAVAPFGFEDTVLCLLLVSDTKAPHTYPMIQL